MALLYPQRSHAVESTCGQVAEEPEQGGGWGDIGEKWDWRHNFSSWKLLSPFEQLIQEDYFTQISSNHI